MLSPPHHPRWIAIEWCVSNNRVGCLMLKALELIATDRLGYLIHLFVFHVYVDPFIKVVLLFDGKKVKKKKTSSRKQENNPVYNECMMFDVPPDLLHRVLFVISVADSKNDSARSDVIGRVVIGSATTGESLRHWHQMLISPRRPVAAWHRLKL